MSLRIAGICFTGIAGIPFHQDFRLVLFSYVIACAGAYAALEMIERWRTAQVHRSAWQAGSAVTLGGSVWSMHFVAMLAVRINLPVTYSPLTTIISLLIAIAAVGSGLQIIRAVISPVRVACAGVAIGLGVAGMHYVGMDGMDFSGSVAYTPALWGLSLVVGILVATLALWLSLKLRLEWQRAVASLVMGAGICGMHYTGMAATVFLQNRISEIGAGIDSDTVAVAVTIVTIGLVLSAMVMVGADRRINAVLERDAAALRLTNEHLRQANAELDASRNAADQASAAKSRFLAMMSHEIRTPMNAVLGLTTTLLNDPMPQDQRTVVQAIHDSGGNLMRILNDVLEFSRLEAGQMALEAIPFSPATLTQQTLSMHGPVAQEKGLRLDVGQTPDLPPQLMGDAGRIGQVLHNLVSNAIKFTKSGTVTVRASCIARDEDSAMLEWTVSDTGIGMSPQQLEALFNPFVQADSSIARRFGGSGLGLAICKQLVDRMGGSITVTSLPSEGTTFRVQLTLRLVGDSSGPAAVESLKWLFARLAQVGPIHVLLAEDNLTNQFVITRMLRETPMQFDIVSNGAEAMRAAASGSYDLIFMDMSMPETDGLEATRSIRHMPGPCRDVPIVAMTANAFPEDIAACRAAGMNDFITKPVSQRSLVNAILAAIRPDMQRTGWWGPEPTDRPLAHAEPHHHR